MSKGFKKKKRELEGAIERMGRFFKDNPELISVLKLKNDFSQARADLVNQIGRSKK